MTAVTDKTGNMVWQSEYLPFGVIAGARGSYAYGGGYTGKDLDAVTGLEYYWNRWMDPTTGRFITEDPARDGINWYVYCENNPITRTDENGLAPGALAQLCSYLFGSVVNGQIDTVMDTFTNTPSASSGWVQYQSNLASETLQASRAILSGAATYASLGAGALADPLALSMTIGKASLLGGITGFFAGGASSLLEGKGFSSTTLSSAIGSGIGGMAYGAFAGLSPSLPSLVFSGGITSAGASALTSTLSAGFSGGFNAISSLDLDAVGGKALVSAGIGACSAGLSTLIPTGLLSTPLNSLLTKEVFAGMADSASTAEVGVFGTELADNFAAARATGTAITGTGINSLMGLLTNYAQDAATQGSNDSTSPSNFSSPDPSKFDDATATQSSDYY